MACAFLVVLCVAPLAEEIHVPGDYPTIQEAIDAAACVAVHAFQSHLVLVLSGRDFQPVFTLKEDDLRGPEPLPRLPESE